jgi:hypothetical protein
MITFEVIVVMLTAAVLLLGLARRLRLPYPALLAIAGLDVPQNSRRRDKLRLDLVEAGADALQQALARLPSRYRARRLWEPRECPRASSCRMVWLKADWDRPFSGRATVPHSEEMNICSLCHSGPRQSKR